MSEKPSFFTELKRRNLYKVTVAYAVFASLIIQIATQVSSQLYRDQFMNRAFVSAH
jgi:hypothetical protein